MAKIKFISPDRSKGVEIKLNDSQTLDELTETIKGWMNDKRFKIGYTIRIKGKEYRAMPTFKKYKYTRDGFIVAIEETINRPLPKEFYRLSIDAAAELYTAAKKSENDFIKAAAALGLEPREIKKEIKK